LIRILYFASLRERLGCGEERIALPAGVADLGALQAWLAARGGVWAETLSGQRPLLAAVNQEMARPDTPLADGDEVGFFPPVTGG
jgi:molybdopterin synthase sulfur carrier subunit